MNRKSKTQGFTLIEVLVVIAIISVLITILLPSFNGARKKPYDVAALQCGKAIVTAEVTYTAEHNNQAASSFAQLNDTDVNEQCSNGIQTSSTPPSSLGATGSGLAVGGSNYSFYIWNPSGTGIYVYNKDANVKFAKIN